MTAIDLSGFAGLTAMVLLTVNILLGLLVTTNYNPVRQWPRKKLPAPLFKIHNWTACLAISVVVLHPALLLFVPNPRFQIADVLLPVSSPGQTLYNNFGALAFYCIVLVVVSSYFRAKLGYRPWKKLHYAASIWRWKYGKEKQRYRKTSPSR